MLPHGSEFQPHRRHSPYNIVCMIQLKTKIRPAAESLPGGAGLPKSNQLEMVTTFTNKPSLVRIDTRNFELSWKQTQTARPPGRPSATDRGDYNTLRRSLARSVIIKSAGNVPQK